MENITWKPILDGIQNVCKTSEAELYILMSICP